jgi:SAF domain
MNPYTKELLPGAGGYTPAPSAQGAKKHARRSFPTWFRTAGRGRYLVAAAIVVLSALTVPLLVHAATGPHPSVLTAARDLPAGHVITAGDLRTATGTGSSASTIPADRAASLIGQQLKVEVPPGAVLAPADLGPFPPTGMTLVPVAVKAGQFPPNLQSGYQVAVFPTNTTGGVAAQAAAHAAATGRVVQIQDQPDSSNGTVVVLLITSTTQAPIIAQAASVVLVTLDAAGDTP